MPNLLAGHVSLVAGTWALETLVKHYFERLFGDEKAETSASGAKPLRKEELLYDEAFGIVKVSGWRFARVFLDSELSFWCFGVCGDVWYREIVLYGSFNLVRLFYVGKLLEKS